MNETTIVADALLSDGWREYPNQFKRYARCFYKRFETPTRCHCNDDERGMQVELAVSEYKDTGLTFELEVCGELADGTWIALHNYSLPQTHQEVTALIPRLLAIWEAANSK